MLLVMDGRAYGPENPPQIPEVQFGQTQFNVKWPGTTRSEDLGPLGQKICNH